MIIINSFIVSCLTQRSAALSAGAVEYTDYLYRGIRPRVITCNVWGWDPGGWAVHIQPAK